MSSTYSETAAIAPPATASVVTGFQRVSWGAVFAGAVVALAIGLMLNVLGAAVAANMVDATARDTPSAASFGIGAGLWMLVANLIALGVGGYTTARLSGTTSDTDATLHGMAMWASSFLISAVLLGNLVAGVASTAADGVTGAIGGVARGVGAATATAGEQVAERANAGTVQATAQQVIDRAQRALAGAGNPPGSMTSDQRKAEMATLVGRRVADGNLSGDDRQRLNALVAAEYGISEQEAQQRVTQAEQQAQQAMQRAEQRAREAADAAAKGASVASYSIFATMLLGLAAAVIGARRGRRDHAVYRRLVA